MTQTQSRVHTHGSALKGAAEVTAAGLFLFGYLAANEATRPSPVSAAGARGAIAVLAIVILATALVGAGTALLVVLGGLLSRPALSLRMARICAGAMWALATIWLLENVMYSATGAGLRTTSHLALKALLLFVGMSTALLVTKRLARMRSRTNGFIVASVLALSVPSTCLLLWEEVHTPVPDGLQSSGAPAVAHDVLVISTDGLDAAHMSVYGARRDTTPFLRAHRSEFQVFENAFTNNGNTTGSITSMLTGQHPLSTGVVYPPDALSADQARFTLPQLLRARGYWTENWAVPHYADAHDQNLVGAFDRDNGDESPLVASVPVGAGTAHWFLREAAADLNDLVRDVLTIEEMDNPYAQVATVAGNTLTDEERFYGVMAALDRPEPTFVHAHFMGTHGPSFRLERQVFSTGDQEEPWDPDFYDDAIRQFDQYLERIYDQLVATGGLEETLIIVTSDHGQHYEPTTRIPLMIRYPDQAIDGVETVNVQRLDIAPTVLDVLGFQAPRWMAGTSLVDPSQVEEDRDIVSTRVPERRFAHRFGYWDKEDGLDLAIVRCRSWATTNHLGEHWRGPVVGSSAKCSADPDYPDLVETE